MLNFLLPWSMVAGGVLISSPIIIHLINRMRYKRIRWAAMEFLLKSQKRNRRRLIIEQLILLLLRCLLVVLAGLLVARFVFAGIIDKKNTLHVILLDDTPSMSDHWKEDGEPKDSFTIAKRLLVEKIAENASRSNTPHSVKLIRLSDLDTVREIERLNTDTVGELRTYLADITCSALHVDLLRGVKKAQELFDASTQNERVLHILSDFRQRDWAQAEGDDSDSLAKALTGLAQGKVKVRLVDVAHPYRTELQKIALYHDNMGISDLRPETRIAGRAMPVLFNVAVTNFSASEKKNVRLTVKVNGSERADASLTINTLPANGTVRETFTVYFEKTGFNQVTANLENEETGLDMDNVRYTVVEVKERVQLLVIDGDPAGSTKPGGDTYHLQAVFDKVKGAAKGYDLVLRGTSELEQPNLDQYPSIYLLNVRDLSDNAIKNLETYVREGGSIAFFLGERVNPEFYNRKLYAEGKGLFPAPLLNRPNPPLSADEFKPEFTLDQNQVFLRDRAKTHPIFAEVYPSYLDGVFKFLPIKRYYPIVRTRWNPEPGKTEELVTLPNRKAIEDYRDSALTLIEKLPTKDPNYARYRARLEEYQNSVRRVLGAGEPLYKLANILEALLRDQGDPKRPEEFPSLADLFAQPEMRGLRDEINRFRESVQFGDPLVIASRFGKGKVVTFFTTAGQRWNHWAGGSHPYVMATYPIVMVELQKYLTSLAEDVNLSVGAPLEIQLDGTRYSDTIKRFYLPEPDLAKAGSGNPVTMGEQKFVSKSQDNRLTFVFNEARKPGVYQFELQPLPGAAGGEARAETRAFAFNVDTLAEGDLRRAAKEELERSAPGAVLQGPESPFDEDANRQSDLSEMPWLFLLILLVLIAEQALAVHLSFHLRGSEGTLSVQAVGPQATTA
jgi:hypothetical protein